MSNTNTITNTENNMNFFDALHASLDDDTFDNENNICQITGEPLLENAVTLECNHKFNYLSLYKEVYKQIFIFKTYDSAHLSTSNQLKYKASDKDYYLRCPYCREIQFNTIPHYEHPDVKLIYGFNTLDKENSLKVINNNNNNNNNKNLYHASFTQWGKTFTNISGKECSYISNNPNTQKHTFYVCQFNYTNKYFCSNHWRSALKQFHLEEKEKFIEKKKKLLEEKQQLVEEKKKVLEEKKKVYQECQIIKKQIAEEKKKKKTEKSNNSNIIEGGIQIGTYEEVLTQNQMEEQNQVKFCTMILKTGVLKGTQCGCKVLNNNPFCGRHVPKNKMEKQEQKEQKEQNN